MSAKDELERQGWKVASVSSGDHLRRVLATYEELGIETVLEEISPEECSGCRECYRSGNETPYRIYVKQGRQVEPRSRKA